MVIVEQLLSFVPVLHYITEAETKGTLMFDVRAKAIKSTVVANVELTADQSDVNRKRKETKLK